MKPTSSARRAGRNRGRHRGGGRSDQHQPAAGPARPAPADRVVIVLFDQMLPQYADQFAMPNFRKLRDSGTDFKKAYLGYMASETVIAHNVITSGLEPRHMGWTDEAYRDHAQRLRQGRRRDAHHRRPQPGRLRAIEKNNGVAYPKLADYLHTAHPGTKFITVGEKSYAVESATGATGDIAVRLSSRRSRRRPVDPADRLQQPVDPGRARQRPVALARRQERAGLPAPAGPSDPTLCGRYFINADKGNDYGTKAAFPSWLYPGEGNRFVPGNDPGAPRWRHLGGRRGDRDDAERELVGHVRHPGRHRQGRPHVGRQADTAPQDCTTLAGMTHVAVRGRERRRPARQDPRRRSRRSTPRRAATRWSC